MTPGVIGRPTRILDADLFEAIIEAIRDGNYFSVACAANGVEPATAVAWIRRGTPGTPEYEERGPYCAEELVWYAACPDCRGETRPDCATCHGTKKHPDPVIPPPSEGIFARFAEEVARARAVAEATAVRLLLEAAPDDWRAAEAWLKRARPERWREEVQLDAQIATTHSGSVQITQTDEQHILAVVRAMEEAGVLPAHTNGATTSNGA